MLYRYLKKILLALTALFWAGCDDTSTSAECLYGPPPDSSSQEATFDRSSSSATIASSATNEQQSSSSEKAVSSSSVAESSSSNPSSGEVSCTPGDSTISYYPPGYSEEAARRNAEEKAKHAGAAKIDSIAETMQSIPVSLANLRQELDMFVALYGAPMLIHTDEVCSDGVTRPTQEYLDYLKMKEEWEKNKPALDAELQKVYEDKLKEIEEKINQCLEKANPDTDLTICDLEIICPDYGIDSKCSYNYTCKDGVSCKTTQDDSEIKCTDKQGEEKNYSQNDFDKKYFTTD